MSNMEEESDGNAGNRVPLDTSGIFHPPFNCSYGDFRRANGSYADSSYQVKQNFTEPYCQEYNNGKHHYLGVPYDSLYFENSYFSPTNGTVQAQHSENHFIQQGFMDTSFQNRGSGVGFDCLNNLEKYSNHHHTSDLRHPSQKRKRVMPISDTSTSRKKVGKSGRGLRHFSKQVCDIVRKRNVTTYLDVADTLVSESLAENNNPANEQNIRRRVYDALNVLMALDIISKDRKQIYWRGFPSTNVYIDEQEVEEADQDFSASVREKTRMIYDMLVKVINTKRLVKENRLKRSVTYNSTLNTTAVKLPFVLISAKKDSEVSCTINRARNEVNFSFLDDFNITEDSDVLDCLGIGNLSYSHSTVSKEEILKSLPKELTFYASLAIGKTYEEFHNKIMEMLWCNKCPSIEEAGTKNIYDEAPLLETQKGNFPYDRNHSSRQYYYTEQVKGTEKRDMCREFNHMN